MSNKNNNQNKNYQSVTIQTPKQEENNSGDSIKRLEDEGIEMLPLSEAKDYIAQEVAKQLAMIEAKRKEDEAVKKALGELEAQKKEKDFNAYINKDSAKFDKILKEDARVTMLIYRKRNKYGISLEEKRAMYNPDGSLKFNSNGKPLKTEIVKITLNGRKFEYDIGPDYGDQAGPSMITNVPWCVACALAERRYPQPLTNPKTGEKFTPQKAFRPTPTIIAPVVNDDGVQVVNSSHESGGNWQTQVQI